MVQSNLWLFRILLLGKISTFCIKEKVQSTDLLLVLRLDISSLLLSFAFKNRTRNQNILIFIWRPKCPNRVAVAIFAVVNKLKSNHARDWLKCSLLIGQLIIPRGKRERFTTNVGGYVNNKSVQLLYFSTFWGGWTCNNQCGLTHWTG